MGVALPPKGGGTTRRRLLQGAGGVAFAGVSLGVLPLFSTPNRHQDPATCRAPDTSARDKSFTISNWPEYIDQPTKKSPSTLQLFEQHFGVKVDYVEDVNDNQQFFAKVVDQLGACQSTGRDMFVLTDWMAARMIQMGWIQPTDPAKVPNLHKNVISSLRAPDWDPKRQYSAPWQAGFTGIAYNKKLVGEVRTMDELLFRSDLKGRVTLLTEMQDTMGLLLLSDGADPSKFTPAQWGKAMDKLNAARASGQIRAFTGNEYIGDLQAGNVAACTAWSGDIANAADPNLVFVIPEHGMMVWADNMLIPNMTPHLSIAEEWINWYYQPDMAAKLADYNYYVCPVEGAQQAMESIDPSAVHNPLIFPTEEYLSSTHQFMALSEAELRTYEGEFDNAIGG